MDITGEGEEGGGGLKIFPVVKIIINEVNA